MEDLYKDKPNSWLWRTKFLKRVYHKPIPSQIPFISIAELKAGYFSMSTLKLALIDQGPGNSGSTKTINAAPTSEEPDFTFTDVVLGSSESTKTIKASRNKSISGMLKGAKQNVRNRFVGTPSGEKQLSEEAKSSSRAKKESRRMQKYFDRRPCQVCTLEKSNAVV